MDRERVEQIILSCRDTPFVKVSSKKGPVLHRPLMGPCLADAFAEVEKHDVRIAAVVMNARLFMEFRKFGDAVLDIETQAVRLKQGIQGRLWGALLFTTRDLGDDEVVIVDEGGNPTRFKVREGYPHEVKIHVSLTVDDRPPVEHRVVVPFSELEHLDGLLEKRFKGAIVRAVEKGLETPDGV